MVVFTLVLNQTNIIMAEIKIEKKKPLWPWVLLVLVIAVVVFLYVYGSNDTEEDDMQIENTEDTTSADVDVLKYENVKFLTKIENHEYNRKALV